MQLRTWKAELHEDYFCLNTSSFNNEKENRHWLASPSGPVKLMKASQPKPYPIGKQNFIQNDLFLG